MHFVEAVVLGIVQGLTEFLPISSSAHLRIVPAFAGWDDPGAAFTAVVQLGTILAVLIYFRRDLIALATAFLRGLRDPVARRTVEFRLALYIILGTIPISVLGIALKDTIEGGFRRLELIGAALVVAGLVLAWAERAGSRDRALEEINARDAAIIGFAQAGALVPGVSRSGATISAGLFLGLDRVAAARYSFLLSVPAIVLSGLFELKDVGSGGGLGPGPTLVGTILAFVVGYASIAWLLRYLVHHTVDLFVGYRVGLGVLVIALAAAGAIG